MSRTHYVRASHPPPASYRRLRSVGGEEGDSRLERQDDNQPTLRRKDRNRVKTLEKMGEESRRFSFRMVKNEVKFFDSLDRIIGIERTYILLFIPLTSVWNEVLSVANIRTIKNKRKL